MKLIVCNEPRRLAIAGSELVVRYGQGALRDRGRFTIAMAGGATPEKTYAALAERQGAESLDWGGTYLFFGDERFVPPNDPRSNYAMVQRTLVGRVAISSSHVFPMPTDRPSAAEAAAAYWNRLAEFFQTPADAAPPRLDLVLLGLGTDGHTASLFPRAASLSENRAWVTWSPPGTLPPPVERITMTYPMLNAARHVVFLVAGEDKAAMVRDVFEGGLPSEQCPAAGVRPVDGTVTWLVDEAAARRLSRRDSLPGGAERLNNGDSN